MTLFNIGPLEFIAILLVMFFILGPEGMVKTARDIGVWIRKTVRSPLWGEILGYSREIRELPTKLVRESGLDEDLKEIQKAAAEATREAQIGIQQASSELDQTLKEAGTVDLKIGPPSSEPTATVTPATVQRAPSAEATSSPATPVVQEVKPVEAEKPKPPVILD